MDDAPARASTWPPDGGRLAILGASARAAAASARRASMIPAAADRFGDRDLQAIADWIRVDDYPRGLDAASRQLPASPWIYTGALENHPDLVDRIAAQRPLLGNPGSVLRAVRDPLQIAACLEEYRLSCPGCRRSAPPAGADGAWLVKPLHSCGGHGIRMAAKLDSTEPPPADRYYQQFIPGPTFSALYVTAAGRARLLGVTRQLTGTSWTGARPFVYCGSIGPVRLPRSLAEQFRNIGDCLSAAFGLIGLMGIDAVISDRQVFPVEVNPRYTASVEVLEHALDRSALHAHIQACRHKILPAEAETSGSFYCGKAILYAACTATVSDKFTDFADDLNRHRDWVPLADIPETGSEIPAGRPIVTVRAEARTPRRVEATLRTLAGQVQAALGGTAMTVCDVAGL